MHPALRIETPGFKWCFRKALIGWLEHNDIPTNGMADLHVTTVLSMGGVLPILKLPVTSCLHYLKDIKPLVTESY